MKHCILTLMMLCLFGSLFGQDELNIDFDKIKAEINNQESDSFYPKLLKRFNDCDSTLTLRDYSLIYYGFSFQDNYLKNTPKEDKLNELLKSNDYEKVVLECQNILDSNPVSLLANNKMGYALFKLKKPESEWSKYQKRYRAIRKVIVYSGNGLTSETAFKVIYVSDEYDILYDYFEIPKIQRQTLEGFCDKFDVTPSDYYKVKEVYFDISRKLIRQQQLTENK
jgi:tetratricopeptide (TPR) repeat protein